MSDEVLQVIIWALGSMGAVFICLFGIWWKIESKQDEKIDDLYSSIDNLHRNYGRDNKELHDKIDRNHHAIRDRLDNIWKHMSRD